MAGQPPVDFFISRAGADAAFAGEIGRILEDSGKSVVLQQWDFANRNFIDRMDEALRSGAIFIRGLDQAQDREKAARHTLQFLADGGFEKPWLLVYDNVDDARVLREWAPQRNVHILLTTRLSGWPARCGRSKSKSGRCRTRSTTSWAKAGAAT